MSYYPNFSDRLTEKRDRHQTIITPLLHSRPSSEIKTGQSLIIRYVEYINALICLRKALITIDLSSCAFFRRLFSMCFPALCFAHSSYLLFPTCLLGSTLPNFGPWTRRRSLFQLRSRATKVHVFSFFSVCCFLPLNGILPFPFIILVDICIVTSIRTSK